MKAIKTNDGISFLLTEEEVLQVKSILDDDLILTSQMENPLKRFEESSVLFFKELKNEFGNQRIYSYDRKVRELKKKYYIVDLTQRLIKLSARGYCDYAMKLNTKVPILDWFELKF